MEAEADPNSDFEPEPFSEPQQIVEQIQSEVEELVAENPELSETNDVAGDWAHMWF